VQQTPLHPPLPLGLGSYVTLSGVAGAVAAFIIAWAQNGMGPTTASLGVAALGTVAVWFAGRSHQAATAITVAQAALGDLGIDIAAPKDDPTFPVVPDVAQTPDAAPPTSAA
jgi:hypothetical protein